MTSALHSEPHTNICAVRSFRHNMAEVGGRHIRLDSAWIPRQQAALKVHPAERMHAMGQPVIYYFLVRWQPRRHSPAALHRPHHMVAEPFRARRNSKVATFCGRAGHISGAAPAAPLIRFMDQPSPSPRQRMIREPAE